MIEPMTVIPDATPELDPSTTPVPVSRAAERTPDRSTPCRRTFLLAAGAGAGGLALAACGSGSTGTATSAATSAATTASAAAGGAGGQVLAQLADVPVGGAIAGTAPDGQAILITQPTAGTAAAFSSVCTHQGCQVAPQGSELVCPCHASKFDLATGAPLGGPAQQPLAAVAVTVRDGAIVTA